MQVKLHHLHLGCENLEKTRDFYINIMGATQIKHYRTAYNLEIIQLKLGDIILALSPKSPVAKNTYNMGIYQLALQVDDIRATMAELEGKGVVFKGSGVVEPSLGVLAAMFDAPDGLEIELMQL